MSYFRPLEVRRVPRPVRPGTAEKRYWKKFKFPLVIKEYAAIGSLMFGPTSPHDMVVTSGTRVQLYDTTTNRVKKTISRFKDIAHSGCLRDDGQLLVAGDNTGLVQVFTVESQVVLRKFTGHLRPVHVAMFNSPTHVITGCDDKTVRIWDIPLQSQTNQFEGHTDYVRAGAVCPANHSLFLSGAYDHTVRLWDARSGQCSLVFDHGAPVECVTIVQSGGLAFSAGGNTVKAWDLVAGRELHTSSHHQKTITAMALDEGAEYLFTGGLDHMLKICNLSTFKVVHTQKYADPIMSVAVAPNNTHLAVGMASGLLSLKARPVKQEEALATVQKPLRGGSVRYFTRGQSSKPREGDVTVSRDKHKKLRPYEVFLRKFEYGNALDAALATNKTAIVTTVLEELQRRGGLSIALSGRDETSLEPLLVFLAKNVTKPHFASLLTTVARDVLDVYGPIIGQSASVDNLLLKIANKLSAEIQLQKNLFELKGVLELLLTASD